MRSLKTPNIAPADLDHSGDSWVFRPGVSRTRRQKAVSLAEIAEVAGPPARPRTERHFFSRSSPSLAKVGQEEQRAYRPRLLRSQCRRTLCLRKAGSPPTRSSTGSPSSVRTASGPNAPGPPPDLPEFERENLCSLLISPAHLKTPSFGCPGGPTAWNQMPRLDMPYPERLFFQST